MFCIAIIASMLLQAPTPAIAKLQIEYANHLALLNESIETFKIFARLPKEIQESQSLYRQELLQRILWQNDEERRLRRELANLWEAKKVVVTPKQGEAPPVVSP
jgi:hypothetical protein